MCRPPNQSTSKLSMSDNAPAPPGRHYSKRDRPAHVYRNCIPRYHTSGVLASFWVKPFQHSLPFPQRSDSRYRVVQDAVESSRRSASRADGRCPADDPFRLFATRYRTSGPFSKPRGFGIATSSSDRRRREYFFGAVCRAHTGIMRLI